MIAKRHFTTWVEEYDITILGSAEKQKARGPRHWAIDGVEVDETEYVTALAKQGALSRPVSTHRLSLDWSRQ